MKNMITNKNIVWKRMVFAIFAAFFYLACFPGFAMAVDYTENFESGQGTWTATGLWHLQSSSGCITPSYQSATTSAVYNEESDCEYSTGATTKGELVSNSLGIASASTKIKFWSYEQTESGTTWDTRKVFVSTDQGGTWTQVWRSPTGGTTAWHQENIDLFAYNGNDIRIKFEFDSVDGVGNNWDGWYVDDIEVTDLSIPVPHTITPTKTGNGNILPNHPINVDHGANFNVTVSPKPNNHIADVKVDGVSLSAAERNAVESSGQYTFLNVVADHTIDVTFEADYQIGSPSFDDISVSEKDGTATFTVTLDKAVTGDQQVTVDYATGDVGDTATAGTDYTTTSGTLTFDSGTGASLVISVLVIDDAVKENDETFTVTLSNPSGNAAITDDKATCTITNDDYVIASISDSNVREDAGNAVFTVTLDRVPGGTDSVTVNYATSDVTAGAPGDYTSTSGTLTFDSTTGASLDITVPVIDDAVKESDETFTVTLSNPSHNSTITDTTATGTITNEDYVIASIKDSEVREDAGNAVFTVTLDRAPVGTDSVTVNYSTSDSTASAPGDYTSTSGTLTFTSGTGKSLDITVPVIDDAVKEDDETFTVTLSGESGNALITDTTATGTITNEDYIVTSITDASVDENSGSAAFTVTLDRIPAGTDTVTVDYATSNGSAEAGSDYTAASGTLTFDSGTGATLYITVTILNNSVKESDETFTVTLSNPGGNATITDTAATGTIVNDDFIITASSSDHGKIEPPAGDADGDVIVADYGDQTFTMTPDEDICVDDVLVDTVSQGFVTNYDFTHVTADHTIVANFRAPFTFTGIIEPEAAKNQAGKWALFDIDHNSSVAGFTESNHTIDLPCGADDFRMDFEDIFGWNTPATVNLHIISDTTETGIYTRKSFTLTLDKTGSGSGTVSAGPGSISGNPGGSGTGNYTYLYQDVVELTAIPEEGQQFTGWTGGVADPDSKVTTVTMDLDKTITAHFAKTTFVLSLAKSGEGTITAGTGSISGVGGGTGKGEYTYEKDDVVTITASPSEGWTFSQWTGIVANNSSSTTTVTMDDNKIITALFTITSDPNSDDDGDGYTETDGDCNDSDSSINPGATEIACNGIDENCDGLDGECPPADMDADNDGVTVGNGDCKDNPAEVIKDNQNNIVLSSSIYPGATEICGDGVDQNCNGMDDDPCTGDDLDDDGDDFSSNEGDCNDVDQTIYPGAPEICGDGTDDDCFEDDRICGSVIDTCSVDIADDPLDTKIKAAPANIMFVLDDSGSMDWEFITTNYDGLFEGSYYVFDNPGDNQYSDTRIIGNSGRKKWKSQWSGYSKMYYNPESTYNPWPRWNVLPGTENDPVTSSDPAFNADPDTPRSNPKYASPVFDFDAEPYVKVWEIDGPKITVKRDTTEPGNHGSSTAADAIKLVTHGANVQVTAKVTSGNDDAEQYSSGYTYLYSGDLDMVCDGYQGGANGVRFSSVTMAADWDPVTNPITEAYIQFTAYSSNSSQADLLITGQADANGAHFSSTSHNITGRTRTAHSVSWNNIEAWSTFGTYRTPNLATVVNDIVASGWTDGNPMVFILEGNPVSCRSAFSYYGDWSSGKDRVPVLILKTATTANEIIIDNKDELFSTAGGSWYESGSPNEHDGSCYYTNTDGASATWMINIETAGSYDVYAWVNEYSGRDRNAPYTVYYNNGNNSAKVYMDQRNQASGGHGGEWYHLGTYNFNQYTDADRNSTSIQRAHYYVWFDENANGTYDVGDGDGANDGDDDGEIYLIELDKTSGEIVYSQFIDANLNGLIDYGEISVISPASKVPDEIKPRNEGNNVRTYTEERQNFANWYSFYRRRELTAKAAVGKVIDDMSGVNIGILTINGHVKQPVMHIDVDGETDQTDDLLNILYGINSTGGTPLRRGLEYAGEYFKTGDLWGVSAGTPYYSSANGGACQQSFAILMTDGYYNGSAPAVGNADGDGSSGYDGSPYGDTSSNTLADVAMHYYETDLSSSLIDKVPTNDIDSNPQQHMVTYSVAFGVTGTLPGANPNCPANCPWPTGSFNSQDKIDDMFHAAVNGRGQFLSAENPKALSDAIAALQHDIEQRIGSGASVAINSQELNEGTILFKGTYDTNDWSGDIKAFGIYTYTDEQAEIDRANGAGEDPNPDIKAGFLKSTYEWSAADKLASANWNTGRVIITYNMSESAGSRGVPFRYANLTNGQKFDLGGYVDETDAEHKVNYFRGDSTYEQDVSGTFRARGTSGSKFKLGDIVHSAPLLKNGMLYVGGNDGMFHAFDATGDATGGGEVFAYVPNLVYQNLDKLLVANPNYQHTYFVDNSPYARTVDKTTTPETTYLVSGLGKGGKGYFCLDITNVTKTAPANEAAAAAIPLWEYPYGAATGELPFAEGNPHDFAVGDVLNASPSNASATITGITILHDDTQHGTGIMTVDNITGIFQEDDNITNQGGSQAKAVTGLRPYDPDLGYSYSRAYIVKTGATDPNNEWVVIFGNGYESPNGEAVLFVLRASDGTLLKKIHTGVTGCNGLSSPAIIDVELDGKVDYAYAGDLKGNLWKFDLTDGDISNWDVAYNDGTHPQPLFKAVYDDGVTGHSATIQPITVQPDVVRPCESGQKGYLIIFGTGRHLGNVDTADISVQTIYGIWDWQDAWDDPATPSVNEGDNKYLGNFMAPDGNGVRKLSNLNSNVATAADVSLLRQSQIFYNSVGGVDYRVLSQNTVDWFAPSSTSGTGSDKHAGWYFDLPIEGERIIRDFVVRNGVLVIISSIPSTSQCASGGDSFLLEMEACSGSRLDTIQFDINDDQVVDSKDLINIGSETKPIWVAPTGQKHSDMMVYTPAILELQANAALNEEKKDMKYFSTSTGQVKVVTEKAETAGMSYWRDLE